MTIYIIFALSFSYLFLSMQIRDSERFFAEKYAEWFRDGPNLMKEYAIKLSLCISGWWNMPENDNGTQHFSIEQLHMLPTEVAEQCGANGIGVKHARAKIRLAAAIGDSCAFGFEEATKYWRDPPSAGEAESYVWHITPPNWELHDEPLVASLFTDRTVPYQDVSWFWTQVAIAFYTGYLACLMQSRSMATDRMQFFLGTDAEEAAGENGTQVFTLLVSNGSSLLKRQIYPDPTRPPKHPLDPTQAGYDEAYAKTYDRISRFLEFVAGSSPEDAEQWGELPAANRRIAIDMARLGAYIYGTGMAKIHEALVLNMAGARYGGVIVNPQSDVTFMRILVSRSRELRKTDVKQGAMGVVRTREDGSEEVYILSKSQRTFMRSQVIQGGKWNTRSWFTARFITHGLQNPRLAEYLGKFHIMQSPECFYNALVCDCTSTDVTCTCERLKERSDALRRIVTTRAIIENVPIIIHKWKETSEEARACAVQVFYFNDVDKRTTGSYIYKELWDGVQELRLIVIYGGKHGSHEPAHCMLFHTRPGEITNPVDVTNFMLQCLKKGPGMDVIVCPCCNEPVSNTTALLAHVVRLHGVNGICPQCGLRFKSEDEVESHMLHFCTLGGKSKLRCLSGEVEEYKPKTKAFDFIVYADTESTIGSDGQHRTCLVGYVALKGTGELLQGYYSFETIAEFMRSLNQLGGATASKIAVYFHNGTGYDFHFLIPELCKLDGVQGFDSVWESSEKVKYFTVKFGRKQITFKDSFDFMATSLAKWIEDCKKGGNAFKIFRACLLQLKKESTEEDIEVLLRKNPFPYKKLRKPTDLLQGIGWFLSATLDEWGKADMTNEKAADAMRHIQEVFVRFKLRSVKDYLDLYLLCDVTMLADCMEEFVARTNEQIGLSPHLYYGSPALSWNAWLAQNKFKIDAISDAKMYDLVKSCIRGGQVQASQRYYNAEHEPGTLAIDLDCNSLYPTAMVNFTFPTHDWHYEEELTIEKIRELEARGESGFVLVDLELRPNPDCPALDDWPFIAESCNFDVPVAPGSALARYQETREHPCRRFTGLLQHHGAFHYYSCSTRNLLWYVEHGALLKKIYYGYFGKCEPVFKEFVSRNLELRDRFKKEPTLKALYKLLSNSLYGKTYEDIEKRTQVTAYESEEKPHGFVRDLLHAGRWSFAETVPDSVTLNKPIFLGACITEWSKLWMYQFFYDRLIPKFPQARIMYTDTDAITVKFPWTRNLQSLINYLNEGEQLIDTSNFTDDGFTNTDNNGKAGLFKSETTTPITEMVALRAKTYIMHCADDSWKMSMKGVPFAARERATMENFKKVLFEPGEILVVDFEAITSKDQVVKSEKLEKIALSGDDLKREICDDLIHTKPHFL